MSYKGVLSEDFQARVIEILREDDIDKFDNYVADIAALPSHHYPALLDLCLEHQALCCTLHLVLGNLPHGPPNLCDQIVQDVDCIPALFTALVSMPEPEVIHPLLEHCGADRHVNQTIMGLCPLHFALSSLCKLVHLSNWSPEQSLTKLLLLLFLPQTRPTLECARLVAEYTSSVNEVALSFIQNGELMQLAGLLVVACEKAMQPLSTGYTIKKGNTMEDLISQVIHGEGHTETICVAGLFDIFDKAGDKLATYYKSLSQNGHAADEVIVRVAEILRSVGIQVLFTDVDLTDIKRSSINHVDLSDICKRLGIEKDDTTKEVQMSRESMSGSWEAYTRPINFVCMDSTTKEKPECESQQTGEGHDSSPHNPMGSSTLSTSSPSFDVKINSLGIMAYSTSSTRTFSTSSLVVDKISNQHRNHSKLKSLGAKSFSTSRISSRPHSWTYSLSWLAPKLKRGLRLV